MCHPLPITHASIDLAAEHAPRTGVRITATVATDGKTGIEMEALTAAALAGLTLYDMCKAVDRGMVVTDILLVRKEGGASGTWIREEDPR
jgi:cyclic pyranopterin phosphate synthase